jgi:CheY-like chemotaxis protein
MLFLDDRPNEHLLLRWAARMANTPLKIQHFTKPLLVKAYLAGKAPFANQQIHSAPALALLDYDLGKSTSLELIQWIRAQRKFQYFPILMYTGTDDPAVVRACYAAGASFFFRKTAGLDDLQNLLLAIANCFKTRPAEFSSLHCLPEHVAFSRGGLPQNCLHRPAC